MSEHLPAAAPPPPAWERWAGRGLGLAISIYQILISRRLPRVCVYTPSCSEYTRLALVTHGLRRGGRLGWERVKRCRGGTFQGVDAPPGVPWTPRPGLHPAAPRLVGAAELHVQLPTHTLEDPP